MKGSESWWNTLCTENVEKVREGPSLQVVTEAMKLKDTCSLEEKLWQI